MTAAASTSSIPLPVRSARWGWIGVWLAAAALRLAHLLLLRGTELDNVLLGDALAYDAWAQRLAAGDWLGDTVFYQAPLYPYFLGVIYSLAGHDLWVVKVTQSLLGACSCVFVGRAAAVLFSRRAGLLAGFLAALCPPLVFFDCLIQKAVLDTFFFTLACLLCVSAAARAGRWRWLAAGLALGLLVLTRENALALLPLPLLWAFQHGRWRAALLALAGIALVLLPVMIRNRAVGGDFQLTTMQMGPNFYIGNNENANGTYQPLLPWRGDAKYERTDATELAEKEAGRALTPGEVSSFWMNKSLDYIRSQPGHWLRLMGKKWLLVWNAAELGDTEEQAAYAAYSPILRLPAWFLHFGVLCPLAVAGAVWTWRDWRRTWLLLALGFCYAASVAAFYVFARYRLPLFPIAIVFASAALTALPGRLRGLREKTTLAGLAAALAAAVFVNWPVPNRGYEGGVTWRNIGMWHASEKRHEQALVCFEKVLALAPDSQEGHAGMGLALGELGRYDEAIAHLEIVVRQNPAFPDARMNLGNALFGKRRHAEALPHLEAALRLKPDSAETQYNYGNVLLHLGRPDAAAERFRKAIELKPDLADAHNNLGALLLSSGRLQEALPHLQKVCELQPNKAGAHANLGVALRMSGQVAEAVAAYQKALAADPAQLAALANLAWILATHPDPAFRDGPRALELASKANTESGGSHPVVLLSLAAAQAECGQFSEAETTLNAALRLVEAQGDANTAASIRRQIDSVRARQPLRDDF